MQKDNINWTDGDQRDYDESEKDRDISVLESEIGCLESALAAANLRIESLDRVKRELGVALAAAEAKIERLTSRGIEDLKHSLEKAEAERDAARKALKWSDKRMRENKEYVNTADYSHYLTQLDLARQAPDPPGRIRTVASTEASAPVGGEGEESFLANELRAVQVAGDELAAAALRPGLAKRIAKLEEKVETLIALLQAEPALRIDYPAAMDKQESPHV